MCFTTFKYHEFFFVGVIKNCVHVLTRKHVCCNHFRVKNCTISDLAAVKRDETCACAWTCFLTPALRQKIFMCAEEAPIQNCIFNYGTFSNTYTDHFYHSRIQRKRIFGLAFGQALLTKMYKHRKPKQFHKKRNLFLGQVKDIVHEPNCKIQQLQAIGFQVCAE